MSDRSHDSRRDFIGKHLPVRSENYSTRSSASFDAKSPGGKKSRKERWMGVVLLFDESADVRPCIIENTRRKTGENRYREVVKSIIGSP